MSDPANIPLAFPKITSPFVETDRTIARVWFQFLRQLFYRVGGSINTLANGSVDQFGVLTITTSTEEVAVVTGVEQADGSLVQSTRVKGAAAVPQVLGASPFTFIASFQGTLVVFGGALDISRDGGITWLPVGLTGGPLPLLFEDQARVTWYGAQPPSVTFLPAGEHS